MSNVPPPIAVPKYAKLRQLLGWLRTATNFSFALAIGGALIVLLEAIVPTGARGIRLGIGPAMIVVAASAVGYLWSMATIEAIAVLIDIEANTRQRKA